jgi:hypothetical protein
MSAFSITWERGSLSREKKTCRQGPQPAVPGSLGMSAAAGARRDRRSGRRRRRQPERLAISMTSAAISTVSGDG